MYLGGAVLGQHYEYGQPGHGDEAYRGSHYGQGEQKDSHAGMALAGGAALGAVGGAWAMHEYSKHVIEPQPKSSLGILTNTVKMRTKKKMRQRQQRQRNRPQLFRETTLSTYRPKRQAAISNRRQRICNPSAKTLQRHRRN
jgi:hypothetical protein